MWAGDAGWGGACCRLRTPISLDLSLSPGASAHPTSEEKSDISHFGDPATFPAQRNSCCVIIITSIAFNFWKALLQILNGLGGLPFLSGGKGWGHPRMQDQN